MESTLPINFLLVKNTCYNERSISVADALYYGGDCFDKIKASLLYRRTADSNQKYLNQRLQCAEYTDYIGGIFDFFIATCFQSPPKIVFTLADDSVERMVQMVMEKSKMLPLSERDAYERSKIDEINSMNNDREAMALLKLTYYNSLNEGLPDCLSERMLEMMMYGWGMITASYPEKDGSRPANFLQQLQQGYLDAKLCYIPTPQAEDWGSDDMGNLLWVKTHLVQDDRSVPFGPIDLELHTWTYHTATLKSVYTCSKKKDEEWDNKKHFGTLVKEVPIAFGLPIFETSLASRACLMKRVERPAIGLFNREATVDFALNMQAYGQPWYAGSKTAAELCDQSNEFALWVMNKDEKCGYLTPENVAFEALSKDAETKRRNFMAAINAAAIDISNVDQHAKGPGATAMDRGPIECMLSFYACKLKDATCEAVDYIIRSRRDEGLITYKVMGLDNFSALTLANKIANAAKLIAMPIKKKAKDLIVNELSQAGVAGASAAERAEIDSEEVDVNFSTEQAFPIPGGSIDPEMQPEEGEDDDTPEAPGATQSQANSDVRPGSKVASVGNLEGDPKIAAKIKTIDTKKIIQLHGIDEGFKNQLKSKIRDEGYDKNFPVLSVDMPSMGKGASLILDGHHRSGASQDLGLKIPSYQISEEQYRGILLSRFKGVQPDSLSELDPYIFVTRPGESEPVPYSEVRDKNDHGNGLSNYTTSSGTTTSF